MTPPVAKPRETSDWYAVGNGATVYVCGVPVIITVIGVKGRRARLKIEVDTQPNEIAR